MKNTGTGHSHAKLIFIGEHSVVYGEPAIALPLPTIQTRVQIIRQQTSSQIESRYYTGPLATLPDQMRGIGDLIASLQERFHDDGHWVLKITSRIPAARGMGSSAATAIAIIRAFFDLYEAPLERATLLDLAAIAEKVTHRNPSGLDAATASSATPLWYVKGQAGVALDLHLDAYLVIADTGVTGATKEAIDAVAKELADHPASAQAAISDLGDLTRQTRQFMATNQVKALGRVIDLAQIDLSALNVSDPNLDHLITSAKDAGALGAKLTGGGRGGCFFALTTDRPSAEKLAAAIQEAGATQTWIQPLKEEYHA